MQKYFNSVSSQFGIPIDGASVSVTTISGAAVAIYSDNGITAKTNPTTTDENGYFEFYAADGRYTLTITKLGIATITISDVLLEDPANNDASSIAFTASGAGAVATTVQTVLNRTVYAADYTTGAVNAAAINRAIAHLGNNGGTCILPTGFLLIETPILITKGVMLQGAGIGGAGLGNSGGTVLRAATALGDMITVSSDGGVVLRDFVMDNPFYAKAAGTAGIRLQGSGGAGTVCFAPFIENVLIFSMYDGIVFNSAANAVLHKVFVQDYTNYGVKYQQDGATDYGQTNFTACIFWDLNVGTSKACVHYAKGGDLHMHGCKFLGGKYQFHLNVDAGETGTVNFTNCSFEQPVDSWMRFEQAAPSINFGNVIMTGCQFAMSQAGQSCKDGIEVIAGTPSGGAPTWIKNINLSNSVFNVTDTNAYYAVSINDGDNILISGLSVNNNSSPNRNGIHVGGSASTALVSDNQVDNCLGTEYSASTYAFMTLAAGIFRSKSGLYDWYFGATRGMSMGSDGRLYFGDGGFGTNIPLGGTTPGFQIAATGQKANVGISRWSANSSGPVLTLGKSRGGAVGSYSIVSAGDLLGTLNFSGDDGDEFIRSSGIVVTATGTPSNGIVPSKMELLTTTAAGTSIVAMTLGSDQIASVAGDLFVNGNHAVPYGLAKSATQVSHTGDTNKFALATISIPANSIGPNGSLEVWVQFGYTSSANAKTMSAEYGGFVCWQPVNQTTNTGTVGVFQMHNVGATNVQKAATGVIGSQSGAVAVAGAVDSTTSQNLILYGQLANSGETISIESYKVIVHHGA